MAVQNSTPLSRKSGLTTEGVVALKNTIKVKVGDRVLLRYRKTKKRRVDHEYFDFRKAKIIKVL